MSVDPSDLQVTNDSNLQDISAVSEKILDYEEPEVGRILGLRLRNIASILGC